ARSAAEGSQKKPPRTSAGTFKPQSSMIRRASAVLRFCNASTQTLMPPMPRAAYCVAASANDHGLVVIVCTARRLRVAVSSTAKADHALKQRSFLQPRLDREVADAALSFVVSFARQCPSGKYGFAFRSQRRAAAGEVVQHAQGIDWLNQVIAGGIGEM